MQIMIFDFIFWVNGQNQPPLSPECQWFLFFMKPFAEYSRKSLEGDVDFLLFMCSFRFLVNRKDEILMSCNEFLKIIINEPRSFTES